MLVGVETSDDALVYKINDETAIIQTLDFFTPIVDDPYLFGQIAAANSLSDVYAMGGDPKLAMNILCFPKSLSIDKVQKILQGGYDKVKESGALLAGGHTLDDPEPKYGLSVTGFIHPDKIVTNCNAQVGDLLVLTKPIGVGIINTAIKADMIDQETYNKAVHSMATLNRFAKDAMMEVGVHSCTDITGFGLLGHGLEMAASSNVTLHFNAHSVPILPGALSLADMGIIPAGAFHNKSYIGDKVQIGLNVPQPLSDCLFDPQTSGGLLIAVEKDKADILLKILEQGPTTSAIIGSVIEERKYSILVD